MSKNIFEINPKGEKFIRFSNTDGKSWMMPIKNMRTTMNLYQPSGIKGKLIKLLLPYIYWIPFLNKVIHVEFLNIVLNNRLYQRLKNAINNKDFQFSIFLGTPSVYQKPTIQITKEKNILAYCKISDRNDIIKLFSEEQKMLNYLNDCGVKKNIPQVIFCSKVAVSSNDYVFVQSTIKTNKSRVVHKWTDKHGVFLTQLYDKTKVLCSFNDTDFAKSLKLLENNINLLPKPDAEIIKTAILSVRKYYGNKEVEFSVYHGDFTPWNMFLEKDELFVFDFEYAKRTYPPFMDWFHYITQIGIIEKQFNAEKLFQFYLNQQKTVSDSIENINSIYLQYLLSVFSLYISITDGKLSHSDRSYICWIHIIKKLINDKKT